MANRRVNADNLETIAQGANAQDIYLKAIPFKLCMIGNASVGKTCIVERYINNKFENQPATLSAAFLTKDIVVEPEGCQRTKVKMQIWDTAGDEKHRAIT